MTLRAVAALFILASSASYFATAQTKSKSVPSAPFPTEIILGENSFIDIGPPFDDYYIYALNSTPSGTSVKRISVTPHGDVCSQPATVEMAKAETSASLFDLLHNKNPCSIPERALTRESKRCKHCLTFSGAHVSMQVQCGSALRNIKSEILDRDIFASNPKTPEHTADIFALLDSLNKLFGSTLFDKPIFAMADVTPPQQAPATDPTIKDLASGKLDSLFPPGGETVSAIYAESLLPPHTPTVSVALNPEPNSRSGLTAPYPPIARVAHFEGTVHLKLIVGTEGAPNTVSIVDGPAILSRPSASAAENWKLDQLPAGSTTEATVDYKLNCTLPPKP
jgi:hypothetical protein